MIDTAVLAGHTRRPRRRWRRRSRAAGVVAVMAVILAAGAGAGAGAGAAAEQPLFLDESSPVPVIADGTVAFAAYGRIEEPGGQVGVDVRHHAGERVVLELAVPDRSPEADRVSHDVLTVEVTSPSGSVTVLEAGPVLGRVDEPTTGTSYLRLVQWSTPAEEGTYQLRVTSAVPTRLVLGTGEQNGPGSVEGYVGPGVEALADWYATPAGTGRAAALDGSSDREGASATSPPPTRGPSPDTGAGQNRDVIGRSAGWPVLAAVLGLMAIVSVLAIRPWRRHPRG